jgi:hypothetical protein
MKRAGRAQVYFVHDGHSETSPSLYENNRAIVDGAVNLRYFSASLQTRWRLLCAHA